ncbi:hypothetical protein BLOT_002300 [Blomia tropicalis]|nr:hypothetical protein BLOT_002300 [Blomia tropicalis]
MNKLICMGLLLVFSIQFDNRTADIIKLIHFIGSTNQRLHAFLMMNPGQQFGFNIQSIINELTNCQAALENFINDLNKKYNYNH